MEIQIHHTGSQNGSAMFEVIRGADMKRTAAVSLPDPATFPVEGHPAKQFLPELRWYLEDYLQSPFGVYPQLAECVAETMKAWGTVIFDMLFTGYARDWYQEARWQNFEGFHIKITSDSPEIMSWPWEALYSGDDGWLALRCCIDRQLFCVGDPPSLPAAPPRDAIHILYVIPRPYGENDVSYNVLADSLLRYISENNLPVTVDILRPPSFDRLRKVLHDRPTITISCILTAMAATARWWPRLPGTCTPPRRASLFLKQTTARPTPLTQGCLPSCWRNITSHSW